MKKNIIIVITFGILIGYLFGFLIFKNYNENQYLSSDGNIYYIQYGVYNSKDVALSNASKLTNYIIKELDEKYYIYLGVTTSLDNALKIQNLYSDKDIYTYIKADYVKNSETLEKLKEYDDLINEKVSETEIESVIKEIFECEELNL